MTSKNLNNGINQFNAPLYDCGTGSLQSVCVYKKQKVRDVLNNKLPTVKEYWKEFLENDKLILNKEFLENFALSIISEMNITTENAGNAVFNINCLLTYMGAQDDNIGMINRKLISAIKEKHAHINFRTILFKKLDIDSQTEPLIEGQTFFGDLLSENEAKSASLEIVQDKIYINFDGERINPKIEDSININSVIMTGSEQIKVKVRKKREIDEVGKQKRIAQLILKIEQNIKKANFIRAKEIIDKLKSEYPDKEELLSNLKVFESQIKN